MPADGSILTIGCPPKLNLYLRVAGRRADGFHELETVFQSVEGGDVLTAAPAPELTLTTDDPTLPVDESNLVLRAAQLLRERLRAEGSCPPGAALHLQKRTPVGAGMGGGSSDAVAALKLLQQLWGRPVSAGSLRELAAELGSDVPFFLQGGTACGTGRGEQLVPLPTPELWFVLVRPPVSVNTGWAYRQWLPGQPEGVSLTQFLDALRTSDPTTIGSHLRNDLEPGVLAGVPEVAAARDWLRQQELPGVMMTGSGSVVFGLALDEQQAREVAARSGVPGKVWTARSLPRQL